MKRLAIIFTGLLVFLVGCAYHDLHREGETVILSLRAPQARDVQFASSLDSFELHPARLIDGSAWEARVPAGSAFSYFYLVDGEVYVPECRFSEADGFGSRNCVYVPGM